MEQAMATALSRNAQLLKYFAQQRRGIPRKRLVKMAYLSDLFARQFLGRPISELEYVVYFFGPYSHDIPEAIRELTERGLAWTKDDDTPSEDEITRKPLFDAGRPVPFDFTLGENEILAYVVANYLDMDMEELLEDVVYRTRPFREAAAKRRYDERIPMELEDNQGREAVGFDLEAVARAEQQAREGHFQSAQALFDGLRSKISARHA
jgi:hypothetical protein